MCQQCERYFEMLKQAWYDIGWHKQRADWAEKKIAELEEERAKWKTQLQ